MMVLFKHRWNRISVRIACFSFFLGTLLMLIALMAENDLIRTLGIVFLVLYVPVTIVLLFILFVTALTNFRDIHEHVMTLIIVLMNFPIALVYLYFLNP
ncbi:MAG: hypothetical protein Mars2KO_04940 [Maribacter sp.]|uniref:hypothetical protein n=1 Tax=Maribacter sp. 2307UL18-2 TaxID=3386274 RepID=UPI0039BD6001